jgi:tetratricopeptide (TPR) repeat protein
MKEDSAPADLPKPAQHASRDNALIESQKPPPDVAGKLAYYAQNPTAAAHRFRQLTIGDRPFGFMLRETFVYRPITGFRHLRGRPLTAFNPRVVYYLVHPTATLHRTRQLTVGYAPVGFVLRRLRFYLSDPARLVQRIDRLRMGDRTVGDFLRPADNRLKTSLEAATDPRPAAAEEVPPPPPSETEPASQPTPQPEPSPEEAPGTAPEPEPPAPPPGPSDRDIANTWFNEGVARWFDNEHEVEAAAEIVKKAFALCNEPRIAIHLAAMYIKMNRNRDAMEVYRHGFLAHPEDRELWFHAGMHILRHGSARDREEFYDAVLSIDPKDPFACFVRHIYRDFPSYAHRLTASIGATPGRSPAKRRFLISCAVWGEKHIKLFLEYSLASLLSPNNLPALAAEYDVHIALFTAEADVARFKAHPLYRRAEKYARFHFIRYDDYLLACARSSDEQLANPVKFALMSCAHYVALEAGRRLDADILSLGADNVVNDGFLRNASALLKRDPGVLAVPGYRLEAAKILPEVDRRFRNKNQILHIPSPDFAGLLYDFMPKACFTNARNFTRFPLFLCWRVDGEGLLVHANHYMPCIIRGRYLKGPVELSIDPLDGRFLERNLSDLSKIHVVTNSDLCLFDAADNPLVEVLADDKNPFRVENVALWLWCYWDGLRRRYFEAEIRHEIAAPSPRWGNVEEEARKVVDQIIQSTATMEKRNERRTTWRIEG